MFATLALLMLLRGEPVRQAGATKVDERTAITWVWMPPGHFTQGCVPGDRACGDDETPPRNVTLPGFWLAKTETTVDAYRRCVTDGACPAPRPDDARCNWPARATHPMNCINWSAATTFCRWAGARLPSATEWEYAAKSGAAVIYPWGNARPDGKRANFCDMNCASALDADERKRFSENGWIARNVDDGFAATAPVGSYPQGNTKWGLQDMAGNVEEWTSTAPDADTIELRGGAWDFTPTDLRNSFRGGNGPRDGLINEGFRCAEPAGAPSAKSP